MVSVIQYTGEFVPIERSERRLDGIVDVWLRKNPRDGEADEVYYAFSEDGAPTVDEIEADFDEWFNKIDEMIDGKTPEEIKIAELTELLHTILGVSGDA